MARATGSGQIPLQLPLEAAQARDDLIVSASNEQAVAYLDSWPDWPGPVGILAGPTGAGKTHLAQIWASKSKALFLDPALDIGDQVQPGHENFVVEDIAQGNFSETWLFHLINTVRAAKGHLLITSRRWPGEWGVSLPDLRSRLKTAHVMEIAEPDDIMLTGVLMKLFSDRQLLVEPSVIDYMSTRMERSLAAAQNLVRRLDELSLADKRAVTKPLASQALSELDQQTV